jgi:hypothetical protein
MARHTFVTLGGFRLSIQPSKIVAGGLTIDIESPSREFRGVVTFDASMAGVIAQALELEALQLEQKTIIADAPMVCGCGIADKSRPCVCSGGKLLPVLDVAQVGEA